MDDAIEPLAAARAQTLASHLLIRRRIPEHIIEQLEEALQQLHLVDAYATKLEIRFPGSELAAGYQPASDAANRQA